jgi:CHAD domain-containing protein
MRALADQWQATPRTPTMQRETRRAAIAAVDAAFSSVVEHKVALDSSDPATVHRMRVAFKKFRYSVEALAPLLPKASSKQLRAMKAFQDSMGDIQDSTVLLASIRTFARKKRGRFDTTLPAVYQELTRNRAALMEAFLPSTDLVFAFWKVMS